MASISCLARRVLIVPSSLSRSIIVARMLSSSSVSCCSFRFTSESSLGKKIDLFLEGAGDSISVKVDTGAATDEVFAGGASENIVKAGAATAAAVGALAGTEEEEVDTA